MPLDRRQIVENAFAVLNRTGLDGLTLRQLAAALQVKAPALYWHFRDKRELLDEMGTEVLRRAARDAAALDAEPHWERWAAALFTHLRITLLGFRDGAKMFSGTYLTDDALFATQETNLGRLVRAGFTLRQAVVGVGALYSYTIGFVIEEQATVLSPGQPDPQYDLAARTRRVGPERFPLAAAAGAEMFTRHDERFREGLDLILAGLTLQLAAAPKPHAGAAKNQGISQSKTAARRPV